MAIDWNALAIPKGPTRKQIKAKRGRTEAQVKRDVRADVFERDWDCRVVGMAPAACDGPHEWAHLRPFTRAQTRNMAPEERHQTAYSARMCREHHRMYDAGLFDIVYLDPERGADGPIQVERR
jgi:hypothetical protein